jgi:hypothetical protein
MSISLSRLRRRLPIVSLIIFLCFVLFPRPVIYRFVLPQPPHHTLASHLSCRAVTSPTHHLIQLAQRPLLFSSARLDTCEVPTSSSDASLPPSPSLKTRPLSTIYPYSTLIPRIPLLSLFCTYLPQPSPIFLHCLFSRSPTSHRRCDLLHPLSLVNNQSFLQLAQRLSPSLFPHIIRAEQFFFSIAPHPYIPIYRPLSIYRNSQATHTRLLLLSREFPFFFIYLSVNFSPFFSPLLWLLVYLPLLTYF